MTGNRRDPLRNFKFRVEIDGIQQIGFSEVTGFETTIDGIEYREGSDPHYVRKLSGLVKYGPITLKGGLTDNKEIHDWFLKGVISEVERKNISIIVVDMDGSDKARWDIVQAWPSKYDAPDYNAKGNEVAIETLEISHEGIVRVQ